MEKTYRQTRTVKNGFLGSCQKVPVEDSGGD